ncbi:L,D-transpeptidase [uncultured Paracoccus sp.]|uniref:L,D-transpeptidase n=1 Tax=uncultured Paracoccus sp. TaxID=189685 RepID=UPI0025FD86D1|nr:L,D-transpeptidase [uncultured Paracoccus sp.]
MRKAPLMWLVALGLVAACSSTPSAPDNSIQSPRVTPSIYQARIDQGPGGQPIQIPAVRPAYLTERNMRQRVPFNGPETPGTIVVDPYARFLYHVLENGEAMRYGIAVGKAGTGFSGSATINRKAAWPSWTPTANMVRTEPELYGDVAGGVAGGINNPLGSRALYLYQGSQDTMYRIHGTMDPSSIGKATSAGCIRLFNQDIIDLFENTPRGTQVRVRTPEESRRYEGPLVETPDGYLVSPAEMQAMQMQAVAYDAPVARR